MQDIKDMKMT